MSERFVFLCMPLQKHLKLHAQLLMLTACWHGLLFQGIRGELLSRGEKCLAIKVSVHPGGQCPLVPLESKFQNQPFPLKMPCLPSCSRSSSWLADLGQSFPFKSEKSMSPLQAWDVPEAIPCGFEILADLSKERGFIWQFCGHLAQINFSVS